MANHEHEAPVARLLDLGEPKCASPAEWINYTQFQLGPDDIPALIRLATDLSLLNDSNEKDARIWGPVHAWRALGQLGAVEAALPLLSLFHAVPDNDWIIEEMPDVFALIGPRAFVPLAAYLADTSRPTYARLVAATSLMQMALLSPAVRDGSVAALTEQLANYRTNSPGVNGVLIANLIELNAVEQRDLIHRVFVESKVDRFIVGDWRDVRLQLNSGNRANTRSDSAAIAASIRKVPPDPSERPVPTGTQRSAAGESRTQPRNQPHSSTA